MSGPIWGGTTYVYPMQLIADSGSTKTAWCLLDETGTVVHRARTSGLNPLLIGAAQLRRTLTDVAAQLPARPTVAHFYGSGCGDAERQRQVRDAFAHAFGAELPVSVTGDLLGAARAVCGHTSGIACILGTGMNSCYYDGRKIVRNLPSLGFVLGDEGSGTILGKELLRDYFYGACPAEVAQSIAEGLPGGRSELLTRVYQQEAPTQFLAGFTRILSTHRQQPYTQALLRRVFDQFAARILGAYPESSSQSVHFVGSIAEVFAPELRAALDAHGYRVGRVLADPMPGLIAYHTEMLPD